MRTAITALRTLSQEMLTLFSSGENVRRLYLRSLSVFVPAGVLAITISLVFGFVISRLHPEVEYLTVPPGALSNFLIYPPVVSLGQGVLLLSLPLAGQKLLASLPQNGVRSIIPPAQTTFHSWCWFAFSVFLLILLHIVLFHNPIVRGYWCYMYVWSTNRTIVSIALQGLLNPIVPMLMTAGLASYVMLRNSLGSQGSYLTGSILLLIAFYPAFLLMTSITQSLADWGAKIASSGLELVLGQELGSLLMVIAYLVSGLAVAWVFYPLMAVGVMLPSRVGSGGNDG